jgi:hypothetical protein
VFNIVHFLVHWYNNIFKCLSSLNILFEIILDLSVFFYLFRINFSRFWTMLFDKEDISWERERERERERGLIDLKLQDWLICRNIDWQSMSRILHQMVSFQYFCPGDSCS